MKSHCNHKETFCLCCCLVLTALMLLGVKKASYCGQTCEKLQEANVRLPIRQQGGKCLPFFWLSELVGGKVKTKQALRRKISFFNVLEQWEGLCYHYVPWITPRQIHLTRRHTHRYTTEGLQAIVPLASIARAPSWADLHNRKSPLAPQVKFQSLPTWPY